MGTDNFDIPEKKDAAPLALPAPDTGNSGGADPLLNEFKQPTPEKNGDEKENQGNPDDFETKTKPASDIKPEDKEKESQVNRLSSALSAEFAIDGLDTINSLISNLILWFKKKRSFGEELEDAEGLYHKVVNGEVQKGQMSDPDRKLYLRIKKVMNIQEGVPFTDDEKDNMSKALQKIFSENGYKMPPAMGFGITVTKAMLTRWAGILMDV